MYSVARFTVCSLILHPLDSCPPPLVIEAAQDPPSLVALALEEPSKSSLELFAGAGVDHWVDAAVEVAEPKDDLKHCFRRFQRWEEGTWKGIKTSGRFVSKTIYNAGPRQFHRAPEAKCWYKKRIWAKFIILLILA